MPTPPCSITRRSSRPTLRQYLARHSVQAAPVVLRVKQIRRLLDRQAVVDVYGLGGLATCPDEIVDLSDGTRVCEWSTEERVSRDGWVEPLRVRFASENDMWRGLHVRAAAKADLRRYLSGLGCGAVSSWMPPHTREVQAAPSVAPDWTTTAIERAARLAKRLDVAVDRTGFDAADGHARDAYVARSGAVVDASEFEQLHTVVVAVTGEADDRARDSLGRRNGGRAKGGQAGARGDVAGAAKSARTR